MSSDHNLDPEAIKARLDEVDAELARKLAELGFTREEVARQMDHSVPAEVRKGRGGADRVPGEPRRPARRPRDGRQVCARRAGGVRQGNRASVRRRQGRAGPSPDELAARARARVGTSRDPIGSVLGELPPSEHLLLFAIDDQVGKVGLNNKRVTVDEARALAAVLARRVAALR